MMDAGGVAGGVTAARSAPLANASASPIARGRNAAMMDVGGVVLQAAAARTSAATACVSVSGIVMAEIVGPMGVGEVVVVARVGRHVRAAANAVLIAATVSAAATRRNALVRRIAAVALDVAPWILV